VSVGDLGRDAALAARETPSVLDRKHNDDLADDRQ